jgi:drug/metabolite transporter (DMT)-like permease
LRPSLPAFRQVAQPQNTFVTRFVFRHAKGSVLALLLGATAIGFAPLFVRLSELGPSATAFYRLFFALPILWLWVLRAPAPPPSAEPPNPRRHLLWMVLAGFFFAGDMALWHWSIQLTTVANATLLTNLAPLLMTLGGRWFFGETISPRLMAGLGVALLGGFLLVGASLRITREHVAGDLVAMLTAVFYAAYLLTVKHLRRTTGAMSIMAGSGVISCALLALITVFSGEGFMAVSTRGWLILLGLAWISHVGGQGLIAFALAHLPAGFSSLGLLWQPAVAAFLAWLLLDEGLQPLQVLGGVAILGGILVAKPPAPARTVS